MRGFAVLTAGVTLGLILAGGLVTTTRTGDSIPQWPHWEGRLEGGQWVEWTHRAIAAVAGLMVAGLAVWTWRRERRPWLRRLVAAAFAGVLVQALLGGVRIFVPRAGVAIVHACLAQVVFSALVAAAVLASRPQGRPSSEAASAWRLAAVTALVVFLQLVTGAVRRHTGEALAFHIGGAILTFLLGALLASRLALSPLRRGALLLAGLLLTQIALGFVTLSVPGRGLEVPPAHLALVSLHVGVGAAILATTTVLAVLCYRSAAPGIAPGPASS